MGYFYKLTRMSFLVILLMGWALPILAAEQGGPELKNVEYFGGPGDQGWNPNGGPGMVGYQNRLFFCGVDTSGSLGAQSLAACYSLPLTASPLWAFRWPNQPQRGGINEEGFADVVVANDGIYCAGWDSVATLDTKGDKEHKAVLVKFPLSGPTGTGLGGAVWVAKPMFFPAYSGIEGFLSATAVEEGGKIFIYATGHAQANWANNTAVLAKFDTSGNMLWFKALSDIGWEKNGYGWGIAAMNGAIYVSGLVHYPYTVADNLRVALWKCDSNGNILWMKTCDKVIPNTLWRRVPVVASEGHLYVATALKYGLRDSVDALILKYGEDGTLLWSKTWGTAKDDIAHGLTLAHKRLYVVGETGGWVGGGRDAFLLEMEASSGEVISVNYHGGQGDDIARTVKVIGKDLYVLGDTKNSTQTGNLLGQSDLMLLHYTLTLPEPFLSVKIDIKPGESPNPINLKSHGKIPVAILSSKEFDAPSVVDKGTVTFGRTGTEPCLAPSGCKPEDVNGDGFLDLVCHFETEEADFREGDTQGILKGKTLMGRPFMGIDSVTIVPSEKPIHEEKETIRHPIKPIEPPKAIRHLKPVQPPKVEAPRHPRTAAKEKPAKTEAQALRQIQKEGGITY